jgi:hypothetical protein
VIFGGGLVTRSTFGIEMMIDSSIEAIGVVE